MNELKTHFSLDDLSGDGDNENIYDNYKNELEIYDEDGSLYGDCQRKAVNIREIESQTPWFVLKKYHLMFSDLSQSDLSKKWSKMNDKDFEKVEKTIQYTKTVNSSFG